MAKKDRKKKRKFDSKKLKERTKQSQKRAKGIGSTVVDASKDVPIVRPSDGRHFADIIPYLAGKNDPEPGEWAYTFEFWVHHKIGPGKGVPVICLQQTFDKECPVCNYQQELREKGDERFKNYWPKRRNLYNIILYDKSEKDKGVQVLDVSWHYFEKYLAKKSEKVNRKTGETETINFASPSRKEGRTVEFEIEPAKSENDYPDWIIHGFEKRDYEIDEETLESAYILDEIVNIYSKEEIEEMLYNEPKGRKSSSEDEDDEEDDLKEELEEIDEFKDLKEFISENNLDVKIKKSEWKEDEDEVKEKVLKALEQSTDDEDEDEDGKKESEYDEDDINDMSFKKLKKIIKKENLDIDIDDYDEDDDDDLDDLREEVIDELGI